MHRIIAIVALAGITGVADAQEPCGQTELYGPGSPEFGTPAFELNRLDLHLEFLDGAGLPSCPAAPSLVVAEISPIEGSPSPFPETTCFGFSVRVLAVSPSPALSPLPYGTDTGQFLSGGLIASSVPVFPFTCESFGFEAPIPDSPTLAGATLYFQGAEFRQSWPLQQGWPLLEDLLFTEVVEVKLSL